RIIDAPTLSIYMPLAHSSDLPVLYKGQDTANFSERDLLYKVLFDMKKDMNDLKQLVMNLLHNEQAIGNSQSENFQLIKKLYQDFGEVKEQSHPIIVQSDDRSMPETEAVQEPEEVEESLSLEKKEKDYIRKALEKYKGRRKEAARELGISERTLYRKIKDYNLE
ncbi:MAG: sigma-54-dependent Fis family transcriptional regulator, partial [Bacteroidetes bacterium]|nr:sigma-54-dependent Fis family transcriptional regulator [Bacteroidota bacterium]